MSKGLDVSLTGDSGQSQTLVFHVRLRWTLEISVRVLSHIVFYSVRNSVSEDPEPSLRLPGPDSPARRSSLGAGPRWGEVTPTGLRVSERE